jgi:galactose-1-phosphate uridylyltransferase
MQRDAPRNGSTIIVKRERRERPMKKIVKPRFVKFRTTCWFCGCIYEYEMSDILATSEETKCPCCNKENEHDAEQYGVIREEDDQ